jgi:hypothetical protein
MATSNNSLVAMNTRWQLPRFCLANVRSLRYKVDHLAAVFQTNKINVGCVTESWLDCEVPTEAVDIDGYVCYRRDRSDGRRCGGVVCYVDVSWPCTRLQSLETVNLESIWILLRRPTMPRQVSHLAVGIIYHPPDAASGPMVNHIINSVDSILQQHPYAGIMILGDCNTLNDKRVRDYPLKQIVGAPTRGRATLDKIYTNLSTWYLVPVTIPNIASSDHCAVTLFPLSRRPAAGCGYVTVTRRSNSTNGKNLLAQALLNFDWDALRAVDDIDLKVTYFNSCVGTLIDFFLPRYTVNRRTDDKPWITDKFQCLIRRRQQAWSSGNRKLYNQLRNQVNRLSKRLRKQYYDKHIKSLHDCNSYNWWRQMKKLTGQSSKPELISLINTVADGNTQILAELINGSLQQVSNDLSPLPPVWPVVANETTSCVANKFIIEQYEVFNKLSRINIHKSPGPDGIPNWFLRDFAFAITEPICHIFNTSVSRGIVPSLWKEANVVPIPKSRPPLSIHEDLRPISLTPTLSKILESLVGRWILTTVEDKLDVRQFGARRGRSTTHALTAITHMWHEALDGRDSIRTLFVDYSKAFDHVDHSTVLRKMSDLGIHPFLLKWMHSFLSCRRQRVKIGNILSDWVTLKGGMPQGTWLGPYVFLILINDLNTAIASFKFVDDVTLTEVIGQSHTSQMQLVAHQIDEWSHLNFMNINAKKTKEMLFGRIQKYPPPLIEFETGTVERVSTFKLLGLTITDNLSWEEHINAISVKASKRLHFLKLLKRSSVNCDDLLLYYKAIIRPVLEYACPVWQSGLTVEQRDRLETVQRRALHLISGSTDYELQCVLLNIEPICVRLEALSRSFFRHICDPADCLNCLLPNERTTETVTKLRNFNAFPGITCRTNHYAKSFLPYSLNNYQS